MPKSTKTRTRNPEAAENERTKAAKPRKPKVSKPTNPEAEETENPEAEKSGKPKGRGKKTPKGKVPPQLEEHCFKPGQSGNPEGRPPETAYRDALAMVRSLAPDAADIAKALLKDPKTPAIILMRLIEFIFDRTYGKPEASIKVASTQQSVIESRAYILSLVEQVRAEKPAGGSGSGTEALNGARALNGAGAALPDEERAAVDIGIEAAEVPAWNEGDGHFRSNP